MSEQWLWNTGFTLVLVGFAIAVIAVVLMFLKGAKGEKSGDKVKGGGVVIIGPIPIIFGTDKESVKIILALSIILMILVLVWMVIYYKIFQ
jgi:uncharacterized protein (TIGR00304 family)